MGLRKRGEGSFLNLLQKEGLPRKGGVPSKGGGGGGSNPGGNCVHTPRVKIAGIMENRSISAPCFHYVPREYSKHKLNKEISGGQKPMLTVSFG